VPLPLDGKTMDMNDNVFAAVEQLQSEIDRLDADISSRLSGLLSEIRSQFEVQAQKYLRMGRAQADAIVHSAEIIIELEETKDRLQKSQRQAESATL